MANHNLTGQDIERLIHAEILLLLQEQHRTLPHISNTDNLYTDLGFASSELIQLLATLNLKLQVNPFAQSASLPDLLTVEDLCRTYQELCLEKREDSSEKKLLLASQKRAQARRIKRRGDP